MNKSSIRSNLSSFLLVLFFIPVSASAQDYESIRICSNWYKQFVADSSSWPTDSSTLCPMVPPKECFSGDPQKPICIDSNICSPPVEKLFKTAFSLFETRVSFLSLITVREHSDSIPYLSKEDSMLFARIARGRHTEPNKYKGVRLEEWRNGNIQRTKSLCPQSYDQSGYGYTSMLGKSGLAEYNINPADYESVILPAGVTKLSKQFASAIRNNIQADEKEIKKLIGDFNSSGNWTSQDASKLVKLSESTAYRIQSRNIEIMKRWEEIVATLEIPGHMQIQADFNRDGFYDYAVLEPEQKAMFVYLSNKNGKRGASDIYPVFSENSISASDVDGDGDADILLVGGSMVGGYKYYRNNGSGKFQLSQVQGEVIRVTSLDRDQIGVRSCVRKQSNQQFVCASTDDAGTGQILDYQASGTFGSFERHLSRPNVIDFSFNEVAPGETYAVVVERLPRPFTAWSTPGTQINFIRGAWDIAYVPGELKYDSSREVCCFKRLSKSFGDWSVECRYANQDQLYCEK